MEGRETRVLIADPDSKARAALAGELGDAGFEVVAVSSGAAAVASAQERQPSIAILEIPLGEICGYEVCRVLRDLSHGGISILFLSGTRTEWYDRVAGLLLGADDYVVKPYARDKLLARVRRLVREVEPERTARLTPREQGGLSLLAAGALGRVHRVGSVHQRANSEDAHRPDPFQARRPQPGAGGCGRL